MRISRLSSKKRDRATAGLGLGRSQDMPVAESQPKTTLRTRATEIVSVHIQTIWTDPTKKHTDKLKNENLERAVLSKYRTSLYHKIV